MSRYVNLYEVTYTGYIENAQKIITIACASFSEAENACRANCFDTNFKVHSIRLGKEGILLPGVDPLEGK